MHIATSLHIAFVGLPSPAFTPRWRCDGPPVLRVFVGRARAIQQALAMTTAAVPRLAIVVGTRHEPVDCADLVVRVPDLRAARVACGVLVALARDRPDAVIATDCGDLARIVAAGGGGDGVILRARGPTLVDAARQLNACTVGAVPHAMVVRTTTRSRPGCLDDLNAAMALLGDVDDQVAELALGVRDQTTSPRPPRIELLAAVRIAANDDDRRRRTVVH